MPAQRPTGSKPSGNRPDPGHKRLSPASLVSFGSIALVVVVILVIVLVKVAGSSKPAASASTTSAPSGATGGTGASTTSSASQGPAVTPASPAVLAAIAAVTPAEAAAVGEPSSVQAPMYDKGQPPLLAADGKPLVLFVGAEFCPYCAAERWAIIMALSRFGTFSNLHETTSSPYDTDPSTPTFTFYKSSYTSSSLELQAVENESNDTTALGTRALLQQVTAEQGQLWQKYEAQYGQSEGFPFLDIDNKVMIISPTYDPAILAGLTQAEVAQRLSNPQDPVTQAIVGSANYITAGICAATGASASPWCTSGGVTSAAKALGLP